MKILLITPLSKRTSTRWIPVGLTYIASSLKNHGHETEVFDRYLENVYLNNSTQVNQNLKAMIHKFKPEIIGFSTFSPVIYDTVNTVRFIRQFYTGIIIAGGHHATAMPALTLERIPGLDYVIAGEAEISLTELADGKPVESIPGIFTRNTNSLHFTTAQIPILDSLPQPDYSIFDMNYYTSLSAGSVRGLFLKTADIVTSRGCSNNCAFCSETLTYGKGVRYHNADYVIETIEKLIADYNINGLYFHDNDFLINPDHVESICRAIIGKGINKKIKWSVQAGTNRINNDILKLLSEAGCVKIELGMESINPEHLKDVRKNRSVEMSEKAITLCKNNGIMVHSYFMTGFEDETIDDLNSLIEWIHRHNPHTFQLSLTQIFPGTSLYKTHGNNFFESTTWTEYNLNKYFSTDFFSKIPELRRIEWSTEKYYPFYSKHMKKALIKTNSVNTLFKIAFHKIKKLF